MDVEKSIIIKLKSIIGKRARLIYEIDLIPLLFAKSAPIKKSINKKEVGVLLKYTNSRMLEKYLRI